MDKEVWWSSLEEPGLEHLMLKSDGDYVIAESAVLKIENKKPFGLFYLISVDDSWRVREVEVLLRGTPERRIKLLSDGSGNWTDEATGSALPEFAGCFEIDISATPFTNTLPVRRNNLEIGAAVDISVVYFLIPEMRIERSRQRYRRLDADLYRFEENGVFAGFSADLIFDEHGLVIDYPNLFRRVEG